MQPFDEVEAAPEDVEALVSVEAAVREDVKDLGKLPPGSAAIVASALALARELDDENSATSKSMCARALHEAMDRLRELAPPAAAADKLDDLTARRATRQSRVRAKAS